MEREETRQEHERHTTQHSKAKCLKLEPDICVVHSLQAPQHPAELPKDYRMGPVEIEMFFLNYDVYSTHLSLKMRNVAFH